MPGAWWSVRSKACLRESFILYWEPEAQSKRTRDAQVAVRGLGGGQAVDAQQRAHARARTWQRAQQLCAAARLSRQRAQCAQRRLQLARRQPAQAPIVLHACFQLEGVSKPQAL